MAENIVELLTDVADAIREKKGTSDKINAQRFSEEIRNLPSDEDVGLISRELVEYSNAEVINMGPYAFAGCKKLIRLSLQNCRYGGKYAFQECAVQSLDFPSLISPGAQCFQGSSLVKVSFGEKLTIVANMAFYGCSTLKTLVLHTKSVVPLGSAALSNTLIAQGQGYIYVRDELVEGFKSATNWSGFADQIKPLSELPDE